MLTPGYDQARDRAERIRRMICDRAKKTFDAAFGPTDSYICFHYAHNWHGQSWLTPAQNAACRRVFWLEQKQWEPSRLVDAWYRRRSTRA